MALFYMFAAAFFIACVVRAAQLKKSDPAELERRKALQKKFLGDSLKVTAKVIGHILKK